MLFDHASPKEFIHFQRNLLRLGIKDYNSFPKWLKSFETNYRDFNHDALVEIFVIVNKYKFKNKKFINFMWARFTSYLDKFSYRQLNNILRLFHNFQ